MNVLSALDGIRKIGRHKSWCLVGKGPSCARADKVNWTAYATLTLNHACQRVRTDIAHFTDWKTYLAVAATLRDLPDLPAFFCLPWHPHLDYRPHAMTLSERVPSCALLQQMLRAGRLLSYNSTAAGILARHPKLPTIRVRFFSGVAALNLLVAAGVRQISTLGIDGGTAYAPGFDAKNLLANGRRSFSDQFTEMERTCQTHRLKLVKL